MTGRDPAWDPELRTHIELAMARLLDVVHDVDQRRRNSHDGTYARPKGGIGQGDLTGISTAGYLQLVVPLRDACDALVAELEAAYDLVDEHRRQEYGTSHYHPMRRPWDPPEISREAA